MQMQKKITLKDDGRFLAYYHFPATATQEETQAFDDIQSVEPQAPALNAQRSTLDASSSTPDAQRSTLNAGGESHV